MRHAYLIIVHQNFKILNKLIEVLDNDKNDFYVLIDEKVKKSFRDLITYKSKYSKVIEVSRITINWAGFSMILAYLKLFRIAEQQKYDYYHLMQGSDFPIKKQSEIGKFFEENKGSEFIHFDPNWYDFGEYKINYHHFFVDNRYYRKTQWIRYISHGIAKIEKLLGIKLGHEKFYSGSAMLCISHDFVE